MDPWDQPPSFSSSFHTPTSNQRPRWQASWVLSAFVLILLCLCSLIPLGMFAGNLLGSLDGSQLSYAEIAATAQATIGSYPGPIISSQPTDVFMSLPTTIPNTIPTIYPTSVPSSNPTFAAATMPIPTIMIEPVVTIPGPGSIHRITPGEFIHDYYTKINQRKYDQTFNMLSDNFKLRKHCCKADGSFDIVPYQDWWNGIEQVDVIWVNTTSQSRNTAVVEVLLRYHRADGRVVEDTHVFTLIADSTGRSWLID